MQHHFSQCHQKATVTVVLLTEVSVMAVTEYCLWVLCSLAHSDRQPVWDSLWSVCQQDGSCMMIWLFSSVKTPSHRGKWIQRRQSRKRGNFSPLTSPQKPPSLDLPFSCTSFWKCVNSIWQGKYLLEFGCYLFCINGQEWANTALDYETISFVLCTHIPYTVQHIAYFASITASAGKIWSCLATSEMEVINLT